MTDLVSIFCEVDDFCKDFFKLCKFLPSGKPTKRNRACALSPSEIMTISLYYHHSGYSTFKDYYEKHVQYFLKRDFKKLVSYNRFIELRKAILGALLIFLTTKKLSICDGYSIIDSSKLEACHIRRASSHKTLASIAKKGKTSTGWFYGLKVHLVSNYKGELLAFCISPGNVSDNNKDILMKITQNISGLLFGDKGYIVNNNLFRQLFENQVKIITKIRKNMKNKLLSVTEKLLLKKRAIIESVVDILKNKMNIQHTRHRSVWGFFVNLISGLTAYQMRPKKPSIDFVNTLLDG